MENYNEKLDILFKEWKEKSKENGHDKFCPDGLMYKGETILEEWNVWDLKNPGNESELWHNAKKRILFLCKDLNSKEEDGSASTDEIRHRNGHKKARFYRNMAYWLYGLCNIDKNGIAPKFETLTDEKITDFFDKTPFAYVNCKKEAGLESVSDTELRHHIGLYKDFINKEIEILNPDIIVCGGTRRFFFDNNNNIYEPLEKFSEWIYFNQEQKKVVIASYHPSAWNISEEEIYTNMMIEYERFLKKHPNFQNYEK
ncbi:MAG: hypothetical protein RBR32_11420 [Bacteroidales bacterium]|nr:hypothetical protein [Bacteroidales bacterium]